MTSNDSFACSYKDSSFFDVIVPLKKGTLLSYSLVTPKIFK